QIILPQKRAALVLDRLLIALQKALHEENGNQRIDSDRDGPRTAPLRLANIETSDM
ncbi:jg157, partial [Pararge aegeria aegeria]